MIRRLAALLFLTVGLRADVEFSGFFLTAKQSLFSLTDLEDKRPSGWLKPGQSFAGYTVVSFDREKELLTVERDGQQRQLALRASKIKDERATVSGTITFMNEKIDGVRATLFFGEETALPMRDGIVFRLKPERMPDGNILYRAKFVTLNKDGSEKVLAAPSVVAIPGQPFGIQIGDVGYSFKP
jgi:hypothetical protein